MPRYDFRCRDCKRVVEQVVPSRTDTFVCESCGGTTDRLFPAPNFTIKGYSAANGYAKKETD